MMSNKLQKIHRQMHRLKVTHLQWATVEGYAATYFYPADLKAWRTLGLRQYPIPVWSETRVAATISTVIEIELMDGRVLTARLYDGNCLTPGWETTINLGPPLAVKDNKVVVSPYVVHTLPYIIPGNWSDYKEGESKHVTFARPYGKGAGLVIVSKEELEHRRTSGLAGTCCPTS